MAKTGNIYYTIMAKKYFSTGSNSKIVTPISNFRKLQGRAEVRERFILLIESQLMEGANFFFCSNERFIQKLQNDTNIVLLL